MRGRGCAHTLIDRHLDFTMRRKVMSPAARLTQVLRGKNYKGLAPPSKTTKQGTPTINPSDRQLAQLIDHAPGTIEKAAHESSRITQRVGQQRQTHVFCVHVLTRQLHHAFV